MIVVVIVTLLYVGVSLGYMPRSGLIESMSNYLRKLQTDFQSGYISLQPHQQWRSVPTSPQPT